MHSHLFLNGTMETYKLVLILVVMEDALAPCFVHWADFAVFES